MQVLETARLRLRWLTLEDAPLILELLNDPRFVRFVGDRGIRTAEGARAYIANGPLTSYAKHGFGLYHVALKENDAPVGMCGLLKRDVLEDVDIGFAYLPQHGGKGYATEAALGTMAYAKASLGLKRIIAITAPDNVASQNVLRKIGLRHERTIKLPNFQSDSYLFTPSVEA
jgi:ribosomal-protein-alanine N-acetyltransferase